MFWSWYIPGGGLLLSSFAAQAVPRLRQETLLRLVSPGWTHQPQQEQNISQHTASHCAKTRQNKLGNVAGFIESFTFTQSNSNHSVSKKESSRLQDFALMVRNDSLTSMNTFFEYELWNEQEYYFTSLLLFCLCSVCTNLSCSSTPPCPLSFHSTSPLLLTLCPFLSKLFDPICLFPLPLRCPWASGFSDDETLVPVLTTLSFSIRRRWSFAQ